METVMVVLLTFEVNGPANDPIAEPPVGEGVWGAFPVHVTVIEVGVKLKEADQLIAACVLPTSTIDETPAPEIEKPVIS
jgi:hypothetical protein